MAGGMGWFEIDVDEGCGSSGSVGERLGLGKSELW